MTAGVYDPNAFPPQQDPNGPVSVPDPDSPPDPERDPDLEPIYEPEPLVNPDEPEE